MKRFLSFFFLFSVFQFSGLLMVAHAADVNLAGEWQFQIDREGKGEAEEWYKPGKRLNDRIVQLAQSLQVLNYKL